MTGNRVGDTDLKQRRGHLAVTGAESIAGWQGWCRGAGLARPCVNALPRTKTVNATIGCRGAGYGFFAEANLG